MSNNEEKSPEGSDSIWKKIISDFLILIAITSCFGYVCKEIMDKLKPTQLFDNIVSIAHKDDINDKDKKDQGENTFFNRELKEKYGYYPNFANIQDNHGATLLMKLSYSNNNSTMNNELADITRVYYIQKLLERPGINTKITDKDGFNALHWASWSGLPRISTILLNTGLDINLQEDNGYSPLMLAAMRGNDKVVALLLGLGADTSIKNKDGKTAADLATAYASGYSQRDAFIYKLIYDKDRHVACYTTNDYFQSKDAPKLVLSTLMEKIKKEDEAISRKAAKELIKKAKKDGRSEEDEVRISKIIKDGEKALKIQLKKAKQL